MSNFYQGLLFLHGHIADPRIVAEAPKPAAPAGKPAPVAKSKSSTKRSYDKAPRAA